MTKKILFILLMATCFAVNNASSKMKPIKDLGDGCIIDEVNQVFKCGDCDGLLVPVPTSLSEYMNKYGNYTNIRYECKSCEHFHILPVDSYGALLFNYKPLEDNKKAITAEHEHEEGCLSDSYKSLGNGYYSVTFTNNCHAKKRIVFRIKNQGYKISLDYGQSWISTDDGVMLPNKVSVEIIE